MTLHSAKGLEFPVVYIAGCEEELLPHRNSMDNDDGEREERRLLYVGMTRAKETLLLSYAKARRRGAELQTTEPSRFLDELPADGVQWHDGRTPPDPVIEQKKSDNKPQKNQGLLAMPPLLPGEAGEGRGGGVKNRVATNIKTPLQARLGTKTWRTA